MGYGEFYTFIKADTAREAFKKAKEEAIKDHGVDSHSCSVANKSDFKEYLPDITQISDLCNTTINNLAAIEKRATTREELLETKEKKSELKKEKSYFRARSKRTGKEKAIAIAHLLIEMEHEDINAPEKAAGVIQALKNEWLVFGIGNE